MTKEKDYLRMVDGAAKAKPTLPSIVSQIKDSSSSILSSHLETLFSSCDDLFFDLSSRAASNNEQNLYFESMREVRLKKNGVIDNFINGLNKYFYQLFDTSNQSNPDKDIKRRQSELDHSTLSLVQNDALEQNVALSSMVSKARKNSQESLYHLNLRFDYLSPSTLVTENNNPLDPQQVCEAFSTACEILDINIKARIIIFKQFDRYVASKLATVYSSANGLLINAGILPKIRSHTQTNTQESQSPNEISQEANLDQQPQFDFSELTTLLASMRKLGLHTLPQYHAYTSNPGPMLPQPELIMLLTGLQQQLNQQLSAQQHAESVRQVIDNILSNSGSEPARALKQPEEDVINLVAMFFDFVLDDRNLPLPIQALISRLQIPVLKIALHDKNFFNNNGHPARKIINTIANASIGLDESNLSEKDRFYAKVTRIIQDITEHHIDGDQLFNEKLIELQQFIDQQEHKSALVEKRTSQVAEGQAKTNLAKATSQKLLFEKLEHLTLPNNISEFLTDQWLNLLILTHLRHGEDSPAWVEAVQLVDDLIWACKQHADEKSLQRYNRIKPDLMHRIATGLSQISNTDDTAIESIQLIEDDLNRLQSAPDPVTLRPLNAAQAINLGHTPGSGSKSWKSMTGIERQQARYKALTYEFIRKAEQLPINTWVSYAPGVDGKTIRCKLSSTINASDSYVFVNRFGFKVLEKQRKEFAYDMQEGRAIPLESGQIFDRAMNNIINNLRQLGGK